jgi:hypothetical protein
MAIVATACGRQCGNECENDSDCPPGVSCYQPADGPRFCQDERSDAGSAGASAMVVPGEPPRRCSATVKCLEPPPATPGALVASGATAIFAIDSVTFGPGTGDSLPGLDLDGLVFVSTRSSGHCISRSGADPLLVVRDGPGGLDDAFGNVLLPPLDAVGFTARLQKAIASGIGTHALVLEKLGDGTDELLSGTPATRLVPVVGATDGGPVPAPSEWSTYTWDRRADVPVTSFPNGYVAGNTWVSGPPQDIVFVVRLDDPPSEIRLHLHHGQIVARLSDDHARITDGTLAGVLGVDELKMALVACAASLLPVSEIGALVDRAADMMVDGTQRETATCDGVSLGLAFTATASQVSMDAVTEPPVDGGCAAF